MIIGHCIYRFICIILVRLECWLGPEFFILTIIATHYLVLQQEGFDENHPQIKL